MRQFIQNKPFVASLLLNLVLFVVFLSIFYTRYGTTDDVEMQMILSGKGVLSEPFANLRYSHIFIGQLLSSLYSYFPNIPWYGYYLTTAHFIGMSAMLYSIIQLKFSLFRIATYVACFLLGETVLLQELQFTSSSLVLGIGASFLLFTAFAKSNHPAQKKWLTIGFLMLMGVVMIRWDSFQLVVILTTPLLLYGVFYHTQKRILYLGFCSFILVAGFGLNQLHYHIQNQDPAWANYNEYNKTLAGHDMLDYKKPQYDWTSSTADDYFYKAGWEYEDLMIFKHWFMADSSVFGLQQFRALQDAFQDCPYPDGFLQERVWNFFVEMPLDDYVFYGFLMLAITLIMVNGNRWFYLVVIGSALIVFGILASLFIYKHLPHRVSFPMAFYLVCLGTLFMTFDKVIHRKTKVLALAAIGLMAISNLKMVTARSSNTAFQTMLWKAELDSLNAQPEQLYIGGGDFYMQALMTPYQNSSDSLFMGFNMLDFGHLSNSPTHFKQLANFELDNIHTTAPIDSNIYLVHRKKTPFLDCYQSFVYRHYGMHIEFEIVRESEEVNIAVYRIKEQIREKPNSQGISYSNMEEFGIKPKPPVNFEEDPDKPRADYKENEVFILLEY